MKRKQAWFRPDGGFSAKAQNLLRENHAQVNIRWNSKGFGPPQGERGGGGGLGLHTQRIWTNSIHTSVGKSLQNPSHLIYCLCCNVQQQLAAGLQKIAQVDHTLFPWLPGGHERLAIQQNMREHSSASA